MSAAASLGLVGVVADEMGVALAAAFNGLGSPRLALTELGMTAPPEVTDATVFVNAYEAAHEAALALLPLRDAQAAGTTAALLAGLVDAIATVAALGPALASAANAATVLTPAERTELVAFADVLQARLVERAFVGYLETTRSAIAQVLYVVGALEVETLSDGPAGSLAVAQRHDR